MDANLTTKGSELASLAYMTGVMPKVARARLGDGGGVPVVLGIETTALTNVVYDTTIMSSITADNKVTFLITIPVSDGGFTIREVGIYDTDDNLIAVVSGIERYKPSFIEDPTIMKLHLRIVLSSNENYSVVFNNNNEAEEFNTLRATIGKANGVASLDNDSKVPVAQIPSTLPGNAGSATKLETVRAINGVNFDGTANITVADSTKLPLTGGTISGDIVSSNYGIGMVGLYNATKYQAVFAMGTSYRVPADGSTLGTLYGIAWTHSNVGGQSKAGLSHQALFVTNGVTQTAIGTGIWTLGTVTAPTVALGTSGESQITYNATLKSLDFMIN